MFIEGIAKSWCSGYGLQRPGVLTSPAMYQDDESIKVFEKQHARDRLAELARTYSGEPDTDLMTTHAASGWQEGWLVSAVSLVAIVILVAVVAFRLV